MALASMENQDDDEDVEEAEDEVAEDVVAWPRGPAVSAL